MSTQDSDQTPPTEPVVKTPPKRKRNRPARAKPKPVVTEDQRLFADDQKGFPKGHDLSPDFGRHDPGVFDGRFFWFGALPELRGIEGVTIAGLNFPKTAKELVSQGANGRTLRVPVFGDTVQLNRDRVELIRQKVRHTVVRWRNNGGAESGVDGKIAPQAPEGRRGQLISIPTQAMMDESKARGRVMRKYVRQAGDEPVSRYLYCVPCAGVGARQLELPDSLEVTGLTWPKD